MHKIDIQHGRSFSTGKPDGTFDVLCNGDHYLAYHSHAEAIDGAREAAGGLGRDKLVIRDYTRPTATAKFTEVPVEPEADDSVEAIDRIQAECGEEDEQAQADWWSRRTPAGGES